MRRAPPSAANATLCAGRERTPAPDGGCRTTPGEAAGSLLSVGFEVAHLVRRERPVHCEFAPHIGSGVHFRECAARFLRRLYARASTTRTCLPGVDRPARRACLCGNQRSLSERSKQRRTVASCACGRPCTAGSGAGQRTAAATSSRTERNASPRRSRPQGPAGHERGEVVDAAAAGAAEAPPALLGLAVDVAGGVGVVVVGQRTFDQASVVRHTQRTSARK